MPKTPPHLDKHEKLYSSSPLASERPHGMSSAAHKGKQYYE